MLTDSKTLFDVMVRGILTTERRLVLDLLAMRYSYSNAEVGDIGFIQSQLNLSDELTKRTEPLRLRELMRRNYVCHPVTEWVTNSQATLDAADDSDVAQLSNCNTRPPRTRTNATPAPIPPPVEPRTR